MKKFFVFILILFIPFAIYAEELKMEWQKSFGGSEDDSFRIFKTTKNNDIVTIGSTKSTDIDGLNNIGEYDALIVKYDKDGNILWKKNYGGSEYTGFYDFAFTSDDAIVAIGYTYSDDIEGLTFNGSTDAVIVKYDKDGNLLWQKSFGGSDGELFEYILITKDDEILIFGSVYSSDIEGLENKGRQDSVIVKYDKEGNLLWKKSFGGSDRDFVEDVLLTSNEEIIIRGATLSTDIDGLITKGKYDSFLLKYDQDGNLIWKKSFGGSNDDRFVNIKLTSNDEIIISGYTTSTDIDGLTTFGSRDALVLKYDKDGNLLWQKCFGGSEMDYLYDFVILNNNDIVIVGYFSSTDITDLSNLGKQDAIILKYDQDGNLIWKDSLGGSENDSYSEIRLTSKEEIIVSGLTYSSNIEGVNYYGNRDFLLVKYDKDGNLLWKNSFGGNGIDLFQSFILTKHDNILLGGYFESSDIEGLPNKGKSDALILKYDNNGNLLLKHCLGGSSSEVFDSLIFTENYELIAKGYTMSSDIDGLPYSGKDDAIIIKYSFKYNVEKIPSENGLFDVEQQLSKGVINPLPNDNYEVDEIIVKDKEGNVLDVEVTKLEDGTYSFDLYTDVSVEVLFKEKLVNPKTGVASYIGAVLSILFISIATFCVLVFNKKSYRL